MTRAGPYMLGRGEKIADLGNLALKAGAAQTSAAVSVYVGELPAQTAGPPLHVHDRTDEAVYILEGEVTIRLGQQMVRASAGAFVWMPRGVPHTFANLGAAPARMLGLAVPGGIEELLASTPRGDSPGDRSQMAALAERFGSRIVGPPLALDHTAADRAASPQPVSPSH